MNGDGQVDLSVTDLESPLSFAAIGLGLGDGSFQPAVLYDAGLSASQIKAGDLNNDGMLDLVVSNNSTTTPSVSVLLQDNGTVVSLSPMSLTFGTQLVGTVSPPQNLTLTNTGPTSITISKISTTSGSMSRREMGCSARGTILGSTIEGIVPRAADCRLTH